MFDGPAPYVKGSDTSKAAAESLDPALPTLRQWINDVFTNLSPSGATCEQIEELLSMSHQTVSARITELRHRGFLVDSGERGTNKSGRKATVWKVNK